MVLSNPTNRRQQFERVCTEYPIRFQVYPWVLGQPVCDKSHQSDTSQPANKLPQVHPPLLETSKINSINIESNHHRRLQERCAGRVPKHLSIPETTAHTDTSTNTTLLIFSMRFFSFAPWNTKRWSKYSSLSFFYLSLFFVSFGWSYWLASSDLFMVWFLYHGKRLLMRKLCITYARFFFLAVGGNITTCAEFTIQSWRDLV